MEEPMNENRDLAHSLPDDLLLELPAEGSGEAWLKLHARQTTFAASGGPPSVVPGVSDVRKWLTKTAENEIRWERSGYTRRQSRLKRSAYGVAASRPLPSDPLDDLVLEECGGLELREDLEDVLQEFLTCWVSGLTGVDEVNMQYAFGELSREEAAAALGLTTGTVKSQLNRFACRHVRWLNKLRRKFIEMAKARATELRPEAADRMRAYLNEYLLLRHNGQRRAKALSKGNV